MSQPMEEQTSKVFGGCEGPDAMYVKLISSDGHEFIGEWSRKTKLNRNLTHSQRQWRRWRWIELWYTYVACSIFRFTVKREHALTSGTIKAMLSGPGQFAENEANEVNFREIPSHVLQKVCMYFTYKVRYTNSSTEIPEFPIAPEIALELLMAANFLDCWS